MDLTSVDVVGETVSGRRQRGWSLKTSVEVGGSKDGVAVAVQPSVDGVVEFCGRLLWTVCGASWALGGQRVELRGWTIAVAAVSGTSDCVVDLPWQSWSACRGAVWQPRAGPRGQQMCCLT